MKKSYFIAVCMVAGLLGGAVSAFAQDADAVVVKVPFEFVAGGATLPAGEYRVSRANPTINRELAISGYGKGSVYLLPLSFDDAAVAADQPTLSFEHVGGKYFLSKIRTPGGVYSMAASREMVMLGKANSPSPSTSSAAGAQ
jgi:hypothetical protein